MEKIEITVIGAGVVGLAVAEGLSRVYQDIFIMEKNSSFGQETSSRNSEVIHAGIYYPKDSLKHKTCVEGNKLLYDFCAEYKVPFKRIGKLIVAIDKNELNDLEALFRQGLENGVEDLKLISRSEIKELEAFVEAEAAIHSPSTGILDSHGFMKKLADKFQQQGGSIAYNTEVSGIERTRDGFIVEVKSQGEAFRFFTRLLVNCAGLSSDAISVMAGLRNAEYKLKYCKGDYFRVCSHKAELISRLIYPVPKEDRAGLGIHATLDLAGSLRLGPDDEYIQKINYDVDPRKREIFYESVHAFLPFIESQDISPDMAGIRPKLQGAGEGFRDFIIKDETVSGFRGLINLIGIESPGFTASLAIAVRVQEIVRGIF